MFPKGLGVQTGVIMGPGGRGSLFGGGRKKVGKNAPVLVRCPGQKESALKRGRYLAKKEIKINGKKVAKNSPIETCSPGKPLKPKKGESGSKGYTREGPCPWGVQDNNLWGLIGLFGKKIHEGRCSLPAHGI